MAGRVLGSLVLPVPAAGQLVCEDVGDGVLACPGEGGGGGEGGVAAGAVAGDAQGDGEGEPVGVGAGLAGGAGFQGAECLVDGQEGE